MCEVLMMYARGCCAAYDYHLQMLPSCLLVCLFVHFVARLLACAVYLLLLQVCLCCFFICLCSLFVCAVCLLACLLVYLVLFVCQKITCTTMHGTSKPRFNQWKCVLTDLIVFWLCVWKWNGQRIETCLPVISLNTQQWFELLRIQCKFSIIIL